MPRVPDASMVTRLRGLQSSVVADPTKKSASFVPAQPALLFSLRSTDVGRGMFPGQSLLAAPIARPFANPRHRGYITGPPAGTPRITVDLDGADYNTPSETFTYTFPSAPPATTFEIALTNGLNVENIRYIYLNDTLTRGILGSVTVSTSPTWDSASFVSDVDAPYLYNDISGTFPGLSTILTFFNVPMVTGLTIEFNETSA